jgi:phosphoribosyl 1,2-cyclic phosphodiesterase
LQTKKSKILIDLGISLKDLESRLNLIGVAADEIDAVLVSHEHNDHIKGVGPLSRRYGTNIYINYPTLQKSMHKIKRINAHEFDSAEKFAINDLTITPFSVSHDAADPVGFTFAAYGKKIGIATDLGVATNLVKANLKDCDMLIVESNHNSKMLMKGPYPWHLKQRVRSRQGHLSNEAALELINEVVCEKTRHVFFAHMSEINNTKDKVHSDIIDLYGKMDRNNLKFTITNQAKPAAVEV